MNLGPWEILAILLLLFYVVCFFSVINKTGYNVLLGILLFVPLVNLILIAFLGFSKWPIERRIEELENRGTKIGGQIPN